MKRKRRTKIVATLGPATDDEAVLRQMIEAGVDVLRLNFSHGDRETHARRIATARRLAQEAGRLVALLQDLQGPKIRVGIVTDDSVELREGSRLVLTTRSVAGTAERISISHAGLPQEVRPGDRILLDDGALELQVRRTRRHEVECIVARGGTLRSHKGVNIPGVALSVPALTVKDEEDLRFGLAQGVDIVALSFVRRPSDVQLVRRVVSKSAPSVPILAKIEKPEALRHLDGIIRSFDGVMVARGDLGIELSPAKVPAAEPAGDAGEANRCPVGLAEDHVALACIGVAARVGVACPHDDIGQTVAVDVSGTGDAPARKIAGTAAVHDEAAVACGDV